VAAANDVCRFLDIFSKTMFPLRKLYRYLCVKLIITYFVQLLFLLFCLLYATCITASLSPIICCWQTIY
jgi:hypothetical protein